jgi:hypothetical protein
MLLANKLNPRLVSISRFLISVSLFLCVSSVSAQSAPEAEPYNASAEQDLSIIYQKSQRIRFLIRQLNSKSRLDTFVGNQKLPKLVVRVKGVQMHSLYFQALSLMHRSSRYSFEQLRIVTDFQQSFDATIFSNIDSQMILDLLDQIEGELMDVAKYQNVKFTRLNVESASGVSASDVFISLLSANREFDNILTQGFQPSDVYQQVVQSINVTIQLLNHFDSEITIQKEPIYVYGKKPSDVWLKLHQTLNTLNQIAETKGHKIFNLDIQDLSTEHILPRDVFQLATTVVSELSFLHHVIGSREPGVESVFVTNKTPSDVYQKASLLQLQLDMLKTVSLKSVKPGGVLNDASQ